MVGYFRNMTTRDKNINSFNNQTSFFSNRRPTVTSNFSSTNFTSNAYRNQSNNYYQMGEKNDTMGIDFNFTTNTNQKEHASSRVHSIMYSQKLQGSRKSLLYLRCQDYMQMIKNENNCLNNLQEEIQTARNARHLNSEMFGERGITTNSFFSGRNMGSSGFGRGVKVGGGMGNTGSFFRNMQGGTNTSGGYQNSFITGNRKGNFTIFPTIFC